MKDIPPGIFEHPNEYIRPNLRDCPFIRVPIDIIPDHRIYVFNYLKEDFLSLVKKQIPLHVTKKILKDSLRGLAEMHSLDIAYLGDGILSRLSLSKLTEIRHESREHLG